MELEIVAAPPKSSGEPVKNGWGVRSLALDLCVPTEQNETVFVTWRWHLAVNYCCSAFSRSVDRLNSCFAFCT